MRNPHSLTTRQLLLFAFWFLLIGAVCGAIVMRPVFRHQGRVKCIEAFKVEAQKHVKPTKASKLPEPTEDEKWSAFGFRKS